MPLSVKNKVRLCTLFCNQYSFLHRIFTIWVSQLVGFSRKHHETYEYYWRLRNYFPVFRVENIVNRYFTCTGHECDPPVSRSLTLHIPFTFNFLTLVLYLSSLTWNSPLCLPLLYQYWYWVSFPILKIGNKFFCEKSYSWLAKFGLDIVGKTTQHRSTRIRKPVFGDKGSHSFRYIVTSCPSSSARKKMAAQICIMLATRCFNAVV